MNRSLTRRRLTAWIAAWSILLSTLVPLISQAGYRASGDQAWLEVCTADGFERVAIDPDPGERGHDLFAQPCQWCKLQSSAGCVPPSEFAFMVPCAQRTSWTTPSPRPPQARLAWSAAQPRAPPSPA